LTLTKNKGDFEEFSFSARITSWVKLTVTSTYSSTNPAGFKTIGVLYDDYQTDTICDEVRVSTGATSSGYPLLMTSMSLRIQSKDGIVILSTARNVNASRYEIVFDDSSTNTTFLRRSLDGSTIKHVATSTKRTRFISETTRVQVWIDWAPGRVVLGMGARIILYYRDESPLTPKYMFLKSPTSNGVFDICGRPADLVQDASHFWPFDKVILNDLNGSKRGTLHGPWTIQHATGNYGNGFSNKAVAFDGNSNWVDLGDFPDLCISDPDLCEDGLTGNCHFTSWLLLRVSLQGSSEMFIISSNGENGRGFAISLLTSGLIRFEVRDTNTRWLIDVQPGNIGSSLQKLGFSWSKSDGLTVVVGPSYFTVQTDVEGEMMESPTDESTHLFVGRPSNEKAKFFKGTIDSIAIYEEHKSVDWMKNYLTGTVLDGFTGSCYQQPVLAADSFYFPGVDPSDIGPNECQEHCNKAYSQNAVITDGGTCKCVNSTDSFISVANEKCDVPCKGNKQLKCGGASDMVLVRSAVSSASSLTCTIPAEQEALTKFTADVQASKTFYSPEKYVWNAADGTVNTWGSTPFQYTILDLENVTTTTEVVLKNNETGKHLVLSCPSGVKSYLPPKGFSMSCPAYVSSNTPFTCTITYNQSWAERGTLDWLTGSAAKVFVLPDSVIVSVGQPSFKRSLPAISVNTSGMYVIPYRVEVDGRLIAFDIDVIKEGYLEIQLLSVLCGPSSRFCSSQKACIFQNTTCQSEKVSCASNRTLRMDSGRCTSADGSLDLPTHSASNFDYKIQSNFVVWVNAGRRRLVPMNSSVDISCDYFGIYFPENSAAIVSFSSCSRCALFYSVASVRAANASNNVLAGLRSPQSANGPSVVDVVPKISLRILTKGSQTILLKYTKDGVKPIKMALLSGWSYELKVRSQYVLSNVSISSIPEAHPTHRGSNVSLVPHQATNATYTFMFNATNISTASPWTMHECLKAGMNKVTVLARNKVSLSYAVCEIECQDEINGLAFAVNGLRTTAVNELAQVNWLLTNGSHVTQTIDPGDGTGLRTLNNSKVSGAIFVASLNKTYTSKGVYKINITACNKLGCKSIQGELTIQQRIANLTLNAPQCIATNHSANFTSAILRGCDVNYVWTTDGNTTTRTNRQSWSTYTYGKSGLYTMNLVAHNNVSTALVSCNSIQVKDTVEGVEVGPVQPSGIPQMATIPYKIQGGTDIQVSICFGDGMCEKKNGTVSAEGSTVYSGSFTHNYTKGGDYVANLTFCNCVGCNSTLVNVHVEIPVAGPKVVVSGSVAPTINVDACSGPLYVRVNELVYMVVGITNGTNVKVLWDYDDGHNSTEYVKGAFHQSGVHSNHSYSKEGNYTIRVKLDNKNGHKVFTCHIVAQNPILDLVMGSNSPQGFPDGSVTITTTTKGARPSDPIKCAFTYGDNKSAGPLLMSFIALQSVVVQHAFPHKGFFNVTVNCSNAVSFQARWLHVEVQDKVSGPDLKSYGTAPLAKRPWVEGEGYNGPGMQGHIFPLKHLVQFWSTSFNGSNLTCSYCFDCNGPEQIIKNTSCGNITHQFTKQGEKDVKLTVKNDVSSKSIKIRVIMDESIQCNEVPNDGPKVKGKPHIFTSNPTKHGPNWCCWVKYGDHTPPDFFVPRNSNCTKPENTDPLNRKEFEGNTIKGNHTFPAVGKYDNVLQCWNRVSECESSTKAVVVALPCRQPIVTIPDLVCNKSQPTKSMRSAEKVIRSKNIIDCAASLVRVFKWEFYRIDNVTNIETKLNMTNLVSTRNEFVTIPPRKLSLGLYKVCFTLNMTEMIGVASTVCCYLQITKSPLSAEISGGSKIAVGWNKTKTIDGTNSRDPDTSLMANEDPKLTCYWFCKSQQDNYTFPTKFDKNTVPAIPPRRTVPINDTLNVTYLGGCNGDGPGRLESTECKLDMDTGKMQENTTYDIKMCMLHDDGRIAWIGQTWEIKQGDPPIMGVKCYFNWQKKLNPSAKTSLSCFCVDCNALVAVFYQWGICYKEPESEKCVSLNERELKEIVTTPLDGRNLAIKPNSLKGGYTYQFICDGWRGKKEGSNNGQSVYMRTANRKPRHGRCNVEPKSGIALNTTFTIQCKGWEDGDTPLKYTYGTCPACNKLDEIKILAGNRLDSEYKVESLLPGPKANNYTIYITVHVADKYKAINISVCIPVQVKEKQLELKQLGSMLNGTVENLLASGSSSEVNQLLSGIATQLNTQSVSADKSGSSGSGPTSAPAPTKSPQKLQEEQQARIELRAKIVETLDKVKPSSISDVTQTTQTLNTALNCDPKEVSPAAKNRQMAQSLQATLDLVSNLALQTMRPGEPPTVMKTDVMELKVFRERAQDLQNKTITLENGLEADIPTGLFDVEDSGGGDEPSAVDIKIIKLMMMKVSGDDDDDENHAKVNCTELHVVVVTITRINRNDDNIMTTINMMIITMINDYQIGVSPLPDNDSRDNYCYEIHVHTGFMRGAGTSAEVSIVMNGSVGDSDPRVLKDTVRKTFRTGGVDAFLMTVPQSLGVLRNIRVWHNNDGGYPSWNLLRVMIQDLQTEQRWWFVSDEWLAVDEADGKIERILYPATSNELTKFNVLFATEIRKNLTDGHLWFSVVTRPARSTFTRVQRLTCCLSILLCSMLANMMFYDPSEAPSTTQQEGPTGTIQIAGFTFSIKQVSIGVMSSLIVFPANLIIVQLFRKARAKEVETTITNYDEITPDDEDHEKGTETKKAKKEGIPHWCVYIAYALAFLSSVAAAVFVLAFGVTFGADKSAKWLLSMTISLVQDVLISQPIKIFILASVFALLIKDPNKAESDPITDANMLSTDEEWLHKNVKDLSDDEKKDFKKLIMDRPPDEAKLEIARQLRFKEKQMKSIIREIVWYMIFLLVILTISYGNRDPDTYRITKYMNDLFVKARYSGNRTFDKVSRIKDYWEWMNRTVIPSVYENKWYDDEEEYPLGFLADTPTDYILAVVRLRQLRIQKKSSRCLRSVLFPDSCIYLPIFQHVISECNDFYSKEEEDHRAFLPGWVIPPNVNTTLHPPTARKSAWEYQSGTELKTFPYWGYKATYDAGGYAKELPSSAQPNKDKAYAAIEELRALEWIDRYTRAIFTELAIYNANTNFFCVITLLYEQLPTGGLFNYPSILTLKLYRYVGGDMYFVMTCEILYMIFTLYFVFRELKKVKTEGFNALKNGWSVTEIFVTVLSLSLVVLYFLRMKFTDDAVAQMREDQTKFVSFNYTAFLDEWINAFMGFIVFLSFVKIIRLLRFNRRMSLLAQTLQVCVPKIIAFLVIYGISFFAYSLLACLVFGQSMEGFGTVTRSATTLMDTILGKFALKEMTDANRVIGPIFFYFYTVTMVFILINMFLSIINDSYIEVNSDVNKQSNDYEIVDFMVHRLKENIGKTMGNAIVPIYKEPKTKLEKDFDSIQENADNIMHHMRNLTFENMRHTRWFDADNSKEKKKKIFEILMEVDWDYFEDELGDSIPVFEDFMAKYDKEKLESVHELYRYKKMREQEMESKMSAMESGSEESNDSDDSDDSDDPSNDSGDDVDEQIENDLLEVPQTRKMARSQTASPGHSIRDMYLSRPTSGKPSSASPTPVRSSANSPVPQSPTGPPASEAELTQILDDVERERSVTDAELNSFLPEIRSVDENNVPKYDSDPEQTVKKSKKKKKSKATKPKKELMDPDSLSIRSKPAWGETDSMSRKSPAGSSEKDRMIPDGAEGKDDEGQDNGGFEEDVPSNSKNKKKKRKPKQSQA
ncbi:hypothetical protein QZH41_011584, partial [Actinostola sp. cb2023]